MKEKQIKVRYIKKHNNYDLTLNKVYDAKKYNKDWVLIESDDNGNKVLYRKNCFKIIS